MLIPIFTLFQLLLFMLMLFWPWIHEPDISIKTRCGFSSIACLLVAPSLAMTVIFGSSCEPFIYSLIASVYCFLTLYRLSHPIDFEQDCMQALPPCLFEGDFCPLIDTLINALGVCCFIMAASLCLCNCSSLSDMILYSGLWCYRIFYWLPRY